ncbi:hypothetical protein HYPSUDRAFT_202479 [Hypholoma sublateritium FD-334 SS-4]|uniref:Uncharacterized protein n=1 Tax=Hypholoma sublateritium (strain FD-334 SS-4) TaxID=945553 RepID=A0A0D2NSX2_HYPSF|nr:hypothetical protein HYPSUDRAFT_202479 [Hypholoma sublateritium FD-334 SS-4]
MPNTAKDKFKFRLILGLFSYAAPSLDRNHGRVQILNGRLYYSPNSYRTVEEPALEVPGENPFVPYSPTSSRRNVMDVDLRNYLRPRWWTRPWGWISFLSHEPDYRHPPFDPLMHIPRRPLRLQDNAGYAMPLDLASSWSNLDKQLNVITYFLQSHYQAPAIRPMSPWAFGYNKVFPRESMMMKAITKSREWFSVWLALLSYLIAKAEAKEVELAPYQNLAKKNWAEFLLQQGMDWTLLDSLISSIAFCFDPKLQRTGAFIDLQCKDDSQPSVYWICSYHIPVWYRWGDEEASDPSLADFGPYIHQLQLGTTFLTNIPTRITYEEEESNITGPPEISVAPLSNASVRHNQGLPAWQIFLDQRKALTRRMEQTETEREREIRLARARKPPTKTAKVFCWFKDNDTNLYIREQVSKKWREDTLGDYSAKQIRYDSFLNEYDCCSEFGSDNESDEDEEDGDEGIFIDYDQTSKEGSDLPVSLPESSLDPFFDEKDGLPSLFNSGKDFQFIPTLDGLEEEVINTAFLYFGYLSPLPAPPQPPLTSKSQQKNFCRFLGIAWNEIYSALFDRPRILALVDFVSRISGKGDISPDEWDVEQGNRACVALMERFKLIREVQGPNGPLFMFDFQEHSTVQWKLTLTTASHALLVCRLSPELQERDIALYLLQNGIPFYTLQDWETIPLRPSYDQRCIHPSRPFKYNFTLRDYVAYVAQCYVLLCQPRLRAAILQGGYLWRAAVSVVSFNKVLDGPSGRSIDPTKMFVVTLPDGKRYIDDALTETEIALLLGVYQCQTGHGDQVALTSWCPLLNVYNGSGLCYGRWTTFNESLYSQQVEKYLSWIKGTYSGNG